MHPQPLELARRHGVIGEMMTNDIRRLADARPAMLADSAALASALRGLGYTAGEVDARLSMSAESPA